MKLTASIDCFFIALFSALEQTLTPLLVFQGNVTSATPPTCGTLTSLFS